MKEFSEIDCYDCYGKSRYYGARNSAEKATTGNSRLEITTNIDMRTMAILGGGLRSLRTFWYSRLQNQIQHCIYIKTTVSSSNNNNNKYNNVQIQ